MKALVDKLVQEGALKTQRIIEAFLANDRKFFVPQEFMDEAYADAPLPIGEGQTISQPYTVAFMLELLEPQEGQKILDIGFGSGWTTAILAHIAGRKGKVFGVEVVPEIYEFGQKNLAKFDYKNIKLYNRSGWEGLPSEAPFDRILVSAAAVEKVPQALKDELKLGGRMVIPVGPTFNCSVELLEKVSEDEVKLVADYSGFAFVPFVR